MTSESRRDRVAGVVCPSCRHALDFEAEGRRCANCERPFSVSSSGQVQLRGVAPDPAAGDSSDGNSTDGNPTGGKPTGGKPTDSNSTGADESAYLAGFRGKLRQSALYPLVFRLLAPVLVTGPDPAQRLASEAQSGSVVDLGSGNDRRHPQFVTVDILPYPEVDVVCDGDRLPFADGSVAGVSSIVVLEHVPQPRPVFSEIRRIVAVGGRVFLVVPFLQPFHAAPHDYRRWTLPGLREDLGDGFEVVDQGVYCGPASAVSWLLAEFLVLIVSLGSARVQDWLRLPVQAIFSPLKWLDLLLCRFGGAERVSSAIYVEARRVSPEDPRRA